MKQSLAIASTLFVLQCLCLHTGGGGTWLGEWLKKENITVTLAPNFQSEQVSQGKKEAQATFAPGGEVSLALGEGELYTGVQTQFPIHESSTYSGREIDFYLGYNFPLTDVFSSDVGYTYHWYPRTPHIYNTVNRSHELHLGFIADVFLVPAIYFFYDFNLQQFTAEASVMYSFPLDDWGLEGFSIDASANGGWLAAQAYNGDQRPRGVGKQKNSYAYAVLGLGLSYSFNERITASLTGNYAVNNDGTGTAFGVPMNIGNHQQLLWWGLGLTIVH